MFKYVLTGDGMMAMTIHSDLNLLEMQDLIRERSKPVSKRHHPCFTWGVIEFVNPRVYTLSDFGDRMPALIGVK